MAENKQNLNLEKDIANFVKIYHNQIGVDVLGIASVQADYQALMNMAQRTGQETALRESLQTHGIDLDLLEPTTKGDGATIRHPDQYRRH